MRYNDDGSGYTLIYRFGERDGEHIAKYDTKDEAMAAATKICKQGATR